MRSVFSNITDTPDPSGEIGWAGGGLGTTHDELNTASLVTFRYKDEDSPVYQDLLVTEMTEAFSEGNSIMDVFGDTFTGFATGAQPTGINITGYLLKLKQYDSRADFLDVYDKKIRGSALQSEDRELQFLIKQSTRFTFLIQHLQVQELADFPEFTIVSMQGVAFDYRVVTLASAATEEEGT